MHCLNSKKLFKKIYKKKYTAHFCYNFVERILYCCFLYILKLYLLYVEGNLHQQQLLVLEI